MKGVSLKSIENVDLSFSFLDKQLDDVGKPIHRCVVECAPPIDHLVVNVKPVVLFVFVKIKPNYISLPFSCGNYEGRFLGII